MHKDFWHERWQASQIGFHQDEINPWLLEYWPTLGLARSEWVFVPLCGKSRDIFWLLEQGYRVIGIEISPIAVEAFFAENSISSPAVTHGDRFTRWSCADLEILCGDFFDLIENDTTEIAGIYDRAALIALPPAMRSQYCEHLAKLMPRHTRGLLVTLEYPQDQMNGPPFSVNGEEVRKLFGEFGAIETLVEADVLAAHARFREKGLTSLIERLYRLERL